MCSHLIKGTLEKFASLIFLFNLSHLCRNYLEAFRLHAQGCRCKRADLLKSSHLFRHCCNPFLERANACIATIGTLFCKSKSTIQLHEFSSKREQVAL